MRYARLCVRKLRQQATLGGTMVTFFFLVALVFVIVLVYFGIDFFRFSSKRKEAAKKVDGYMTDAGGVLFVQGNRTYYQMPNGVRRKIADYAMDLSPGSRDMAMFTQIMDEARRQKEAQDTNDRKAAKLAMERVARVANGYEEADA